VLDPLLLARHPSSDAVELSVKLWDTGVGLGFGDGVTLGLGVGLGLGFLLGKTLALGLGDSSRLGDGTMVALAKGFGTIVTGVRFPYRYAPMATPTTTKKTTPTITHFNKTVLFTS